MNQDIKNEWVADLRSGRYEQGQQHLNENGKHCCLGVLCEQYCRKNSINMDEFISEYAGASDEVLPYFVAEWAGLGSVDPTIYDTSFATKNDAGMPFSEIADLIERHF